MSSDSGLSTTCRRVAFSSLGLSLIPSFRFCCNCITMTWMHLKQNKNANVIEMEWLMVDYIHSTGSGIGHYVGHGETRIVYTFGDNAVLKVPRVDEGNAPTLRELQLVRSHPRLFPNLIDSGKIMRWEESIDGTRTMKKCDEIYAIWQRCMPLQAGQHDRYLIGKVLQWLLSFNDLNMVDCTVNNIGMLPTGTLVCIDGGAFNIMHCKDKVDYCNRVYGFLISWRRTYRNVELVDEYSTAWTESRDVEDGKHAIFRVQMQEPAPPPPPPLPMEESELCEC